jgi:ADP-ribosylglycohydrolase
MDDESYSPICECENVGRILVLMLGAIAGDIIGSVHEHAGTKTKSFPLFTPRGIFTDDTVLTVAVEAPCVDLHQQRDHASGRRALVPHGLEHSREHLTVGQFG